MGVADLHRLPSVERLVQQLEAEGRVRGWARPLLVECARSVVDAARARLLRNEPVDLSADSLLADVRRLAQRRSAATLARAVNATGIILHTNLGRAPLSTQAAAAVADVTPGYSTLEIGSESGQRGSRYQHVEPLLTRLTNTEAAIVVNNNAAAVLLALTALARGKQVIVSRGELVEIGGSFRLPEVMAQSGAVLVEVGTTNRTYLHDYERAITAETALLLKVHRSNFVLHGFVHEASAAELVDLAGRHGVPVMFDLGSGCLVDLRTRGLPYEPTVSDAVRAGCDVMTFSGDKLLGGPQAGLIVGRSRYLETVRTHPLARAVRMDKLDYAALAATLRHYLDPDAAWREIPVLRMLGTTTTELRDAAAQLRARVAEVVPPQWKISVESTIAEVGGGSVPGARLPSYAVAIRGPVSPDHLDHTLRAHHPPVFGIIRDDMMLLDVRTLLPGDDAVIVEAIRTIASE